MLFYVEANVHENFFEVVLDQWQLNMTMTIDNMTIWNIDIKIESHPTVEYQSMYRILI